MTVSRLALSPRQRDVEVGTNFVNRESLANDVHVSVLIEQLAQAFRPEAFK